MLSTLIQFGLLSLGLAAALILFVSLKQEFQKYAQKNRARMEDMAQQLQAVQAQNTQRPEPEPAPILANLHSGMNVNKRVQALRLLRRGEDLNHVAAALGVPRREVELLVKVQQLSAQRANAAGAGK